MHAGSFERPGFRNTLPAELLAILNLGSNPCDHSQPPSSAMLNAVAPSSVAADPSAQLQQSSNPSSWEDGTTDFALNGAPNGAVDGALEEAGSGSSSQAASSQSFSMSLCEYSRFLGSPIPDSGRASNPASTYASVGAEAVADVGLGASHVALKPPACHDAPSAAPGIRDLSVIPRTCAIESLDDRSSSVIGEGPASLTSSAPPAPAGAAASAAGLPGAGGAAAAAEESRASSSAISLSVLVPGYHFDFPSPRSSGQGSAEGCTKQSRGAPAPAVDLVSDQRAASRRANSVVAKDSRPKTDRPLVSAASRLWRRLTKSGAGAAKRQQGKHPRDVQKSSLAAGDHARGSSGREASASREIAGLGGTNRAEAAPAAGAPQEQGQQLHLEPSFESSSRGFTDTTSFSMIQSNATSDRRASATPLSLATAACGAMAPQNSASDESLGRRQQSSDARFSSRDIQVGSAKAAQCSHIVQSGIRSFTHYTATQEGSTYCPGADELLKLFETAA